MINEILGRKKSRTLALVGGVVMSLSGAPSGASNFYPDPIYDEAISYTTEIPTTVTGFDAADIYFPVAPSLSETFPLALMLQGARVDKKDYSNFATLVARYGFTVVVPNHERTLFGPMGSETGFFPDVELVKDVLDFMKEENLNDMSLVQGKVDTTKMGLLGHSFGGAVGLTAVQGICFPVLCSTSFIRPEELMAGIFYGTSFINQMTGEFLPINNQGIPTGLICDLKKILARFGKKKLDNLKAEILINSCSIVRQPSIV